MNPSELLDKFLEFENSSSVLDYRYQYHNMLIWPFIRIVVLDAILKSYNGEEAGYPDSVEDNLGKSKILSYKWLHFFKFRKNALLCRKQKEILFLTNVGGNVKDDTGHYYDRIHDDLVALHDNTAIIESAPLFRHFYPRKYEVMESDFIDILCVFNEKFTRVNRIDQETIDAIIIYLKNNLPFRINEKCWRTVKTELERYAKNNRLIYQYYKKCFMNIQPKLVFVTQGCYGNHVACKIKVLKDLNISCVEIQHGLIGKAHFAYNYSNKIYQSEEYQTYMPDVFLAMGKYWMECVRIPIKMEVLGSVNFNRNRQEILDGTKGEGILVLPVDTQPYLDLVMFLGEKLPDEKIIVKIHPLFPKQYEIFSKIKAPNIKVRIDGNIYSYLKQVNIVIGDNSTVLYEAAAVKKVVMVWRNAQSAAYTDPRLGHWFNDKYELLKLLQGQQIKESENMILPEDIFECDIKTNYLNFIKNYL